MTRQSPTVPYLKLLILFSFLLLAESQSWQSGGYSSFKGGQLPHLYAGVKVLGTGTAYTTNINFNETFTQTIEEKIFSTTEQTYIGTSLYDLKMDTTSDPKILFVQNLAMDASKTILSFDIIRQDNIASVEFKRISLSYIIIGSEFSGYSNTVQSSYIYTRNSQMQAIDPAVQSRQFDFQTDSEDSPFDYFPGSDLGQGCGVIKKSGKLIIEEGQCEFSRFYVFVTGFSFTSDTVDELDVSSILKADITNTDDTTYQLHDTTIYKTTSTDTQVGLFIRYGDAANGSLKKVQLSFVFIGVRSYTESSYPSQSPVELDDFIFFAGVNYAINGDGGTSFFPFARPTSPTPLPPTYDDTKFLGNAFCGFNNIKLKANQAGIKLDINADPSVTLQVTDQDNLALPTSNFLDVSCVMFTKREPCEVSRKGIDLVETSDRIDTQESTYDVQPITELPPGESSGINDDLLAAQPSLKFSFDQPQGTQTSQIKLKYDIEDLEVLEGQLFLSEELQPGDKVELNLFGIDVLYLVADASGNVDFQFATLADDILNNEITFTFTGQRSSALSDEWVEISLAEHQVVVDGTQCVSSCGQRQNQITSINMLTTPPSCAYCKSGVNQIFDPFEGECTCGQHFTVKSTQPLECEPCADQLCYGCSDSATCTQCIRFAELTSSGCVCSVGYYQLGDECKTCPIACSSCASQTSCTSCLASNNTRTQASQGCACLPGLYENATQLICLACSSICKTCEDSAFKCITCDADKNFQLSGTTCNCKVGYYKLQRDNGQTTCQKCDSSCLSCQISALKCTNCDPLKFRSLNNNQECICKEDYIELNTQCYDVKCRDIDENCQSCALDPLTNQRTCLSCGQNRMEKDSQCVCERGFHEKSQVCLACGDGCEVCTQTTNCFQCPLNSVNQGNGTCTCPSSTFLQKTSQRWYCTSCHANCISCYGSRQNCTNCINGFIATNQNRCVCPAGLGPTSDLRRCEQCMANCQICQNLQSCKTCSKNYIYDGRICSLSCPTGYYHGGSQCIKCPQGCSNCDNGYNCLSCSSQYKYYLGSCRKQCPNIAFQLNGRCYSCISPCATCSSMTECTTCVRGYVYFQDSCLKDCPPRTFYADGSCLACSPVCQECVGSSTKCTKCSQGLYLYNDGCYSECPAVILNGGCTDTCPQGKYFSGNSCLNCNSKCKTCRDSASSCIVCNNNYYSYNNDCVQNCPSNTFTSGSSCVQCDKSCLGCIDQSFNCVGCASGYVRSGLKCIQQCFPGMFINSQGQCQHCSQGCSECFNQFNCLKCSDQDQYPVQGVCKKLCPVGSSQINGVCVCNFGYMYLGYCVSSCPSRYYPTNKVCSQCQVPCKDCFNTAKTCLNCIDGYTYNPVQKICQTQTCPYGQYPSNSGQCVRLCPSNRYLYKNFCIFSCPTPLYEPNSYGGCIQKPQTSVCEFPLYQQGSSCVSACTFGYFGDLSTRVCEKCIDNCQFCLNANECISCSSNFTEVDGKCVQQRQCAANQITFEDRCYNSCPTGTYFTGGTCQRICAAGTYYFNFYCYIACPFSSPFTDYACVSSCGQGFIEQSNGYCAPS